MKKLFLLFAIPFGANAQLLKEVKPLVGENPYNKREVIEVKQQAESSLMPITEKEGMIDRYNNYRQLPKQSLQTPRFYYERNSKGEIVGYYEINNNQIIRRNQYGEPVRFVSPR